MNGLAPGSWFVMRLLARVFAVLTQWLSGNLTTRQVVRIAARVMGFDRWGLRLITRASFITLNQAAAKLSNTEDALRQVAARNAELRTRLDEAESKTKHLRRVEFAYRQIVSRLDDMTGTGAAARRGVQALINAIQCMLFGIHGDTGPSKAAATLVLGDCPPADCFATLINLSEGLHGARPFQYALPIFAAERPFPLPWPRDLPALRIVDVGSQELSTERDIHAPLRDGAPVEIIGFDPFARTTADTADQACVNVIRADGARIKTFPTLLADGSEVTFHINRYDPTSSILPSNHRLTRQFGLLDLAVETIETRKLWSRRMDDVLPIDGPAARIDLLKIDVQGAAHVLLQNAPKVLANTLICHVEAEFSPVYLGENLFSEIDALLRAAGFCFVDFFSLGRQRYASFETSRERAFHRGRTLWADCIYVRGLDTEGALSAEDLFRAAYIVHCCYNKQDVVAELLRRRDAIIDTTLLDDYVLGPAAPGSAERVASSVVD